MKRIALTLLSLMAGTLVYAQQLPQFSQYMLNGYLINPAVAGTENYVDVKLGWRNQWSGIEGAPESKYLTAHMPLNKTDNRHTASSFPSKWRNGRKALFEEYRKQDVRVEQAHHGLGLSVRFDKAGQLKRSDFSATYSYHLPISKSLKISTGLSAGLSMYRVDQSNLNLTNPNDPTFIAGDYDRMQPNIVAGALLYSKRFYLGAAAADLFHDELSRQPDGVSNTNRSKVHYNLTGGYKILVSPEISLLPSTLINYVASAPLSADVNLKILYKDLLWVGASYKKEDTFTTLAGVHFKNRWQISYAYGASPSTPGSNEIVFGLLLNNHGKIISPSNFW